MGKTVFYHGPGDYQGTPDQTLSFAHWGHPVNLEDFGDFSIDDGNGGHATWSGFGSIELTKFNDVASISSTPENFHLHGGAGDDWLQIDNSSASAWGDAGNDHLTEGQNGALALYGGAGDDVLVGQGADLTGGRGNDI